MGEYAGLQVVDSESGKILSPCQQRQCVLQLRCHEEAERMQASNQPLVKRKKKKEDSGQND